MALKAYSAGEEPAFPANYDVTKRVTLNFTDIINNNNKYYNLEVQVSKSGESRIFTQYGRVGGTAAKEYRICTTASQAESEADKIVKAKTKKGYVEVKLVKADVGSDVGKSKVEANTLTVEAAKKAGVKFEEDETPSKLHVEVKDLIRTWFGVTQEFIELNLDTKKCPLGQLSIDQITKGKDILEEARKIVHMKTPDVNELNSLTNQYYSNIPHNFGYRRINADALRFDADDKIECKFYFYNSNEDNIKEIETRLNDGLASNNASEIIVIKGALRVGKRLPKQHIRCILDTKSQSNSNAATVIQALLGRCCGNDINNSNNIFNIYCNSKEIEDYIAWWNETQNGRNPLSNPSSGRNKSNVKNEMKKISSSMLIFSTLDEAYEECKKHCTQYRHELWFKPDYEKKKFLKTSVYATVDMCNLILNEKFHTHNYLIFEVDGPNSSYEISYKKLLKKHPDIKNKFVLFKLRDNFGVERKIQPISQNHFKKGTIQPLKLI